MSNLNTDNQKKQVLFSTTLRQYMKESLFPFFDLIPDRVTAPRTEILILFTRGEDQKEPLAHRGRHLAAGAKEFRRFKIFIVRLTFHRLKHNAQKAVRQAGIQCQGRIQITHTILLLHAQLCPIIGLGLGELVGHQVLNVLINPIFATRLEFFNLGSYLLHHLRVPDHIDRLLSGI